MPSKSERKKIPNLRRYTKTARNLERSPLNAGRVEWIDTVNVNPANRAYNLVDLFCGCGGLTLGFKQANFTPLFGTDIDPASSATFGLNFPEATRCEVLIERLSEKTVSRILKDQKIHVLAAGFPCPGFSVAGDMNMEDPRNQLYREIIRFTRELQPWFIVLENVPGLTTMRDYLARISSEFKDIGYSLSVLLLESAKYSVPQIRPRVIFVGNRFELKNPFPKPLLEEGGLIPIEAAINDLEDVPRNHEINHQWTRHREKTKKRISKVPPGGSLYSSYMDAWKRQYRGVPAMTIKENHGGNHIHYKLNRVLSAREMARLQSFPDSFFFIGTMKRVLFQVGNAVPPLLARHIALALRPSLNRIVSEHGGKKAVSKLSTDQKPRLDAPAEKFRELASRVGKEVEGIWDVYIKDDGKGLLHQPIAQLNFPEVLFEREKLASLDSYELVTTEVIGADVLSHDPCNRRRAGHFRKIEWFDTNFEPISQPAEVKEVNDYLEKESNWLSGGPYPRKS